MVPEIGAHGASRRRSPSGVGARDAASRGLAAGPSVLRPAGPPDCAARTLRSTWAEVAALLPRCSRGPCTLSAPSFLVSVLANPPVARQTP